MVPLDSRVHYSLAEKYSVSVAGETKTNAALPENQRWKRASDSSALELFHYADDPLFRDVHCELTCPRTFTKAKGQDSKEGKLICAEPKLIHINFF